MAKIAVETEIPCGKITCNDCPWVWGESVGDPFCGWFHSYAVEKPENIKLGKYKTPRSVLRRLPECIAAEIPPKVDLTDLNNLHSLFANDDAPPLTTEEIDELLVELKKINAEAKE